MIEIRRILCPVDFSEYSRLALDHAVALARWYDASVVALHVMTPVPVLATAPYVGPEALQPFALSDIDRGRIWQELRAMTVDEGAPGVRIEPAVEDGVNVAAEVLVQARRFDCDLIVLGTHGRSGLKRLVLGSVAERVLREAACPVMTVPPAVPDAVPALPGLFRRILCPVDFSESSRAALEYALSIAQEADADLMVAHVLELLPDLTDPPFALGVNMSELAEDRRARLRAMVPEDARTYCRITENVTVGKAWWEILRIASEGRSDLIVLGVQGHGLLDAAVFGSTTQHVIRRAACPVLTVRAR